MACKITAQGWQLLLVQPGGKIFEGGWTHQKIAPCLIVAQAVRGAYEVTSPRGHTLAKEGECFLARSVEELTIIHHPPKSGGQMQARWVHLDFLTPEGFDPTMLSLLPLKIQGQDALRTGERIERLRALLEAPNEEMTQGAALAAGAEASSLAYGILQTILESLPPDEFSGDGEPRMARIRGALRLAHERLTEELTPADLAAAAYLSLSHFHALFRERMGCSPMLYLKRLRLRRAQQLLIGGTQTLDEVARLTGFRNAYHFSREFKRETGIPPGEFRTRHRW